MATYDEIISGRSRPAIPPLDLAGLAGGSARAAPATGAAGASLLARVGATLADYVRDAGADRDAPVAPAAAPADVEQAFSAAGAPLALAPGDPPLDDDGVLAAVQAALSVSVRTGHPRFFGQLYGRADPAAIAGDWLAAAAPAAVHTWEANPVGAAAEAALVARLADLAGGAYAESRHGLTLPGGSAANAAALVAARHVADPGARARGGAGGPRLQAFVSEGAHFSFDKAAITMGLGTNNLVKVPTTPAGAMDPTALASALAAAIADGARPFFVGATAGTTVLGAFDPLDAVAEIADAYGCWLHVDGAWGGAALLSGEHRYLLAGLHRADSFCVSPHKMLGVPLQCAVLVTRHEGVLGGAVGVGTGGGGYLYRSDRPHAASDPGDAYAGCGRRADAVKAWLAWKAAGEGGLGAKVDAAVGLAAYAASSLAARGDAFALAAPPSFANVCFWYVPRTHRPLREREEGGLSGLEGVAPALRARVARRGGPVVSAVPLPGRPGAPAAFRLVIANPTLVRTADVDALLDAIAAAGEAEYR